MYNRYFGLKERPFKLVPNPAYLYLSRSHAEALGHLKYAVQDGDGFAEITGEAGTGKTTVCRMFLESLDDQVEAAYIFNPKMDSLQLLKNINAEFGLRSEADNIKDLIDDLNRYLLEKKAEKKHVILLIDEAQNLSKDVLEQLRLLSNLEMSAAKLIQIILVGQPELSDMLDSHELRQLAQRITLRCHLLPLTLKETREYIRHRLRIASHGAEVRFTWPTYRTIFRYSRGIPRLINVVCDRSLLLAYTENKRIINRGIVHTAIGELKGHGRTAAPAGLKPAILLASLGLVLLLLILFFPGFSGNNQRFFRLNVANAPAASPSSPSMNQVDPASVPAIKVGSIPPAQAERREEAPIMPMENQPRELKTILQQLDRRFSRNSALTEVLKCWKSNVEMNQRLVSVENDQEFFRLAAGWGGLRVVRIDTDLQMLCRINVPAILELYPGDDQRPHYLALTRVAQNKLTFMLDNEPAVTEAAELTPYWKGAAVVSYRNFYNYSGVIPASAPRETILTLKMHLSEIGYKEIEMSPLYDPATRRLITMIQEKHGLRKDGMVGPLTAIVLYNATASLDSPHLREEVEKQE